MTKLIQIYKLNIFNENNTTKLCENHVFDAKTAILYVRYRHRRQSIMSCEYTGAFI